MNTVQMLMSRLLTGLISIPLRFMKARSGSRRTLSVPFPLEVANILADMKLDMESIAAALLHDVIEDTPASKEDISDMFGPGGRAYCGGRD